MASLYQRSSGSYYANFYLDGSRVRFSLKTKDKRKALKKLTELEEAQERGEFDPFTDDPFAYDEQNDTPTVAGAIHRFTQEKEQQGRAERTVGTYRNVWSRFAERVGPETLLSEIDAATVHSFVHDDTVSDATCHKRWRHVRAVLLWAECSIVDNVNPPRRPDKLPTPVREDELAEIIKALKEDYREKRRNKWCRPGQIIWAIPIFRFVFYTGLRASEIGRLKWKHIDLERGLILIERQKNNREQTVPLISPAQRVLRNVPGPLEPDYFVFRTPGGPLRNRNAEAFGRRASRRFSKAREESGVQGKTFHDLRAGFATVLADAGMSAHQIREAMRHSDLSTALKYVKVSQKRLREEMEDAF